LKAQNFAGAAVQVKLDDRDMRGGDKVWQYIKQGVPIRAEIGPRDMAKNEIFVGRRDKGPKEKSGIPRGQFVTEIGKMLQEIQDGMFQKALQFREQNTKSIDTLKDFEAYFSGDDSKAGAGSGGFALAHWNEAAIGHPVLAALKVTPRCIPMDAPDEAGTCIFTGKPSTKRIVFAKAY
jgi:prolyl-tRNA synthetase